MPGRDAFHPSSRDVAGKNFPFHPFGGSELLRESRIHEAESELEQAPSSSPAPAGLGAAKALELLASFAARHRLVFRPNRRVASSPGKAVLARASGRFLFRANPVRSLAFPGGLAASPLRRRFRGAAGEAAPVVRRTGRRAALACPPAGGFPLELARRARFGRIGTRPLPRGQAPAQARGYLAALGEGMVLVDAR